MAFPTKNDILIGIFFICVGVIYALCDRWLVKMTLNGTGVAHPFDHFFLMWAVKQFLQLQLLVFSVAIERNWLGCARFKHGDIVQRVNPCGRVLQIPKFHDNNALVINSEDEVPDGNGHLPDEPSSDNDVYAAANDDQVMSINEDINSENEELVQHVAGDKLRKARKVKRQSFLMYLPPAVFAQAHMLLMYFGLKLTYSSSFIMFKGTVAFFTALLSMAFLAQQLPCYVWFGVVVATLGFAVSGISDYIHVPAIGYEKYGIAAGNLLIVMAQIMFATKIIYEEKFIRKHSIHPMKFLGCEAICGTVMAVIFVLVFNFVGAAQYSDLPSGTLEDVKDALYQFSSSWMAILAVLGSLVCYILYTYLGLFLIRDQGALARIMIETFVWGIFWSVCLILHWETFFIAQVPGLCIITIGALIYSHILVLPFSSRLEGIDHNSGGFTDQFLDLNRHPKPSVFEGKGPREVDEEVLPEGRDGARYQHQDGDADLIDQDLVVQLHQQDDSSQENMPTAYSVDERLIQA